MFVFNFLVVDSYYSVKANSSQGWQHCPWANLSDCIVITYKYNLIIFKVYRNYKIPDHSLMIAALYLKCLFKTLCNCFDLYTTVTLTIASMFKVIASLFLHHPHLNCLFITTTSSRLDSQSFFWYNVRYMTGPRVTF